MDTGKPRSKLPIKTYMECFPRSRCSCFRINFKLKAVTMIRAQFGQRSIVQGDGGIRQVGEAGARACASLHARCR